MDSTTIYLAAAPLHDSLGMEIRLKLRKIGSSFMIAIPSQVVGDLGLRIGDNMLLDIKGSNIIIRKEVK
jgi:antitoxin component of MazEF toxin-antitoxin module